MSTLRDIIADVNDQASSTAKYTSNLFKFTVNGKPAGIYAVTGMTLVLVGSMIYINKDNEGKDTSFMGTFFPGFGANAKKDEEGETPEEDEESPEEGDNDGEPPVEEEGDKGEESPVEEEPQEEEPKEEGDNGGEPPVQEEGDNGGESPVQEEEDKGGEPPVEEKPPEAYGGKTRKRKIKKKNYTISRRR